MLRSKPRQEIDMSHDQTRCAGLFLDAGLALVLASGFAACGGADTGETTTTERMAQNEAVPVGTSGDMAAGAPSDTAPAAVKLDDQEVAGILAAADRGEIASGELVRSTTKDPEVKRLADHMVEDHQKNLAASSELLGRIGITPAESDPSMTIERQGREAVADMSRKQGVAADRAYVDAQVTTHSQLLDLIDRRLVLSTESPDLKDFIVKLRPRIEEHLEHARRVQASLAGR
jgi:putative membrane protein